MDRLLIATASLAGLVLFVLGCGGAGDASSDPSKRRPPVRIGETVDDAAISGSLASLPPGIQVDPATGLLIGVVPPDVPGATALPWERLREYEYRPNLEGMPESLRALDGQRVVMVGFLMPAFEYDDIREFHLVGNHWSCCYGVPPGLDSAVHVRVKPDGEGLPNTLRPLRVIGTLKIGEVKESGILYAIYSIPDADVAILDY